MSERRSRTANGERISLERRIEDLRRQSQDAARTYQAELQRLQEQLDNSVRQANEELIRRINELARKAKSPEGLTPEEAEEREALRKDYIRAFRENLRSQLERIDIQNPDGSVTSVRERHDRKYGKTEWEN